MQREIEFNGFPALDILGVKDQNLDLLKKFFPKLKLISRGHKIIAMGDEEILDQFEIKFERCLQHYEKVKKLNYKDVEHIVLHESLPQEKKGKNAIVYGQGGKPIHAKTKHQKELQVAISKNDLVFAVGPAGTGKTYIAVAMAVAALKNKEVKRIVLTRPAVEAGENLGFLPGDLKDKLDPYLMPLYDGLRDMIPTEKLQEYFENGTIEIAPLAFMRGRTLSNCFVILDEAQNATEQQMKMFLTRMGLGSKFVITGDQTQIDLPKKQASGLVQSINLLKQIKGIEIVQLSGEDVVRHPLVKQIIKKFD